MMKLRLRPLPMLTAVVATLLACGAPGSRREPTPALGPYAVMRAAVTPVVRPDPVTTQDAHGGASVLRETRRMCDLRGGKGSC